MDLLTKLGPKRKEVCMNYLISGFSGAGKSTLLAELREVLSLKSFHFVDLDSYLVGLFGIKEEKLGEYIEKIGFDSFRKKEKEALFEILSQSSPVIISLGGGSLTKEVVEALSEEVTIVYLKTPFSVCFERIKDDSNRPLVKLGKEKLEKLYQERRALLGDIFEFQTKEELIEHILG